MGFISIEFLLVLKRWDFTREAWGLPNFLMTIPESIFLLAEYSFALSAQDIHTFGQALDCIVAIFFNPYLPALVSRQKSGKGRPWGSSDLPRVTQLGSV